MYWTGQGVSRQWMNRRRVSISASNHTNGLAETAPRQGGRQCLMLVDGEGRERGPGGFTFECGKVSVQNQMRTGQPDLICRAQGTSSDQSRYGLLGLAPCPFFPRLARAGEQPSLGG